MVMPKSAAARGAADAAPAEPNALPAAPMPAAQESQSLSTLKLDQPQVFNPEPIKLVNEVPSRRKWIALALVEHGAAAFDAFTTREAISRGAVEADPMMRPFAGNPSIYAAIQVAPIVMDLVARRMQRSQNSFIRKMWWLPQTSGAAMYIFSGVHNIGVAGQL